MKTEIYQNRVEKVRNALSGRNIDTFMVLVEENRRYMTGYTGEDSQFDETAGVLFITADRLVLATDARFDVQAAQEATGCEIVCYKKGLAEEIPAIVKNLGTCRLGFESVRLSCFQYHKIKEQIEKSDHGVELVPVEEIVEKIRIVKSEDEIEATRKALSLAEKAFESILPVIAVEMTEKEAAWSLEQAMKNLGADDLSFPIICAAGTNAALPHAIPGGRKFQKADPVLFDWGARLAGYCSDTTRTLCIGEPDGTFKKVYHTVREAQKRAIDAIGDGVSSKAVDAVAREFIENAGFKGKFGHGLGHGTGLAVHEGPRLSPLKDTILRAGMIVTVEPGIYLPEWGGVRLENQVVVRENGAEVLNTLGFLEI
ncbi:MAG: aminopeptidase P family protein [Desulfobacterales bacterium]|nr:aminopeptidase P family protein [Desulfobacterales bacterium]